MRRGNYFRVALIALVLFALALAVSTCGGKQTVGSGGTLRPDGGQPGGLVNQPGGLVNLQSTDSALAELDALPCPEGVDAALWAELKGALEEALLSKEESRFSNRDSLSTESRLESRDSGVVKLASAPPTGEANRVNDLAISDNGDGTYTLSWHYRNLGDYDQNGKVAIADITPLAQHFGEEVPADDTGRNSLQAVIDGSGNGKVGIEDVTPIAQYFNVDCAGYRIEGWKSVGGWGEVDSLQLAQPAGVRIEMTHDMAALGHDFYRVIPYDADGADGVRSLMAPYAISQPPNIVGVSPTNGIAGESLSILAMVDGSEPFSYSWDFGGGAIPNTSTEASPTVTLGTPNTYSAALTATNAFGEDTYPFTLTVTAEPTYSISGHVEKDTGGGLQGATLTLTPGDYSATANSSGDYTITGVPNGGYTLTPSEAGWSFEPPTLSVTVNNGNVSGKNFTATKEAAKWRIVIADSAGDVGYCTSLAIVNGNPAISYYDDTNDDLKYVRANDAQGSSWGSPITVDSAGDDGGDVGYDNDTSLAIVNGNPAISYYDWGNGDLKYVRASDANGTSWGSPITVDSAGDVGWFTSLAIVNGNPAISYLDYTNYDLKYVRASNADGSSWRSAITVDSAGDVGWYTSLYVVNGNPAISYYDYTNYDLKYARATDANGTSWNTYTVDSAGDVGEFTSLAIVDGNPAISYLDCTNGDLKYARATDANGTSWNTYAVDSAGWVGVFTSLAIVNGNPAISYDYDDGATNVDLKYVRATNADGSSWGTPVTVDSAGDVGWWTSLAVVNGSPAISYYDDTNGDLKYAIFY